LVRGWLDEAVGEWPQADEVTVPADVAEGSKDEVGFAHEYDGSAQEKAEEVDGLPLADEVTEPEDVAVGQLFDKTSRDEVGVYHEYDGLAQEVSHECDGSTHGAVKGNAKDKLAPEATE
jgi:hypothetical protein